MCKSCIEKYKTLPRKIKDPQNGKYTMYIKSQQSVSLRCQFSPQIEQQIQCNPNENPSSLFDRNRKADSQVYMQKPRT